MTSKTQFIIPNYFPVPLSIVNFAIEKLPKIEKEDLPLSESLLMKLFQFFEPKESDKSLIIYHPKDGRDNVYLGYDQKNKLFIPDDNNDFYTKSVNRGMVRGFYMYKKEKIFSIVRLSTLKRAADGNTWELSTGFVSGDIYEIQEKDGEIMNTEKVGKYIV